MLSPADALLLLPSAGLCDLVSPTEAALMAHAFAAPRLAALRDALAGAGAGADAGAGAVPAGPLAAAQRQQPGAAARQPAGARVFEGAGGGGRLVDGNVASGIVHAALAKAADRHNARYRQRLDAGGLTVILYASGPCNSSFLLPARRWQALLS